KSLDGSGSAPPFHSSRFRLRTRRDELSATWYSSCIKIDVPEGLKKMGGCQGCAFKGMSTAVEDTFVGVRFRDETNPTLCSTGGRIFARGERVIVDLESGPAFGHVEQS